MEPEYPVTVNVAAKFLGVSEQLVYLKVERKEIPHFRVGRRIGFLMSALEAYRATLIQEVENGKTEKT
jgi:excisionase family DNA binding protein